MNSLVPLIICSRVANPLVLPTNLRVINLLVVQIFEKNKTFRFYEEDESTMNINAILLITE